MCQVEIFSRPLELRMLLTRGNFAQLDRGKLAPLLFSFCVSTDCFSHLQIKTTTAWEKTYSRHEYEHTHAICLLFHSLLIVVFSGRRQAV